MAKTPADRLLRLTRKAGELRSSELSAHGIKRQYLSILTKRGLIRRTSRGLYIPTIPTAEVEAQMIAEACKKVPAGVVCLLSALRLHGLTTHIPFEVWMSRDVGAVVPDVDDPPIRFVKFPGMMLGHGVEKKLVEGVDVRVYGVAKTIADCFKFAAKIGRHVPKEALKECLAKKRATVDEIWHYAKICRVSQPMRAPLEAAGGKALD